MNLYSKSNNGYSPAIIWWHGVLEQMGYDVTYEDYAAYDPKVFLNMIKEKKPDYVIHPTYTDIHYELAEIREYTKLIILQSDDRWRYEDFSKKWIPFVYGVITFEGNKSKYVEDGLDPDAFYKIRWCFNPNMMCINDKYDKDIELSHTGGLHGDRSHQISQINALGKTVHIYQNISYEDAKQVWARTKYNLCFTFNSLCNMREMKGRIVEIPNYGVLFTEDFPDLNDYYSEDEIVVFDGAKDLTEKINYFENNPNELLEIFKRGKIALWNRNTAYHEWNKILPLIDKDFNPIDSIKMLKEYHGDHYYGEYK